MKNLFKISLLFVVIIIAILSCQKTTNQEQSVESQDVELRSSDPCFQRPPASCLEGTLSNAITLPGFGECNFVVSIDYFFCYGGLNVANYIVSDYEIVEYQCLYDTYEDSLAYHSTNGTLAEFEARFNKLVWQAITNALLSSINNVTSSATITYNTRSCVKSCYYIIKKGELTGIYNKKISCGIGCCKIIRNYKKINGVWVLLNIADASDPTNCFDDTDNICDFNAIYSTECRQQCDDLLF